MPQKLSKKAKASRPPKTDRTKFKTEMCKNWIEVGTCPYNNKCQFAHGNYELTDKSPANEKYKSKTCQQFHGKGFCPYGNRCLFRHEDRTVEELTNFHYYWKVTVFSNELMQSLETPLEDSSRRLPIFQTLIDAVEDEEEEVVPPFKALKQLSSLLPLASSDDLWEDKFKLPVVHKMSLTTTNSTQSEDDEEDDFDTLSEEFDFGLDTDLIEGVFLRMGSIY